MVGEGARPTNRESENFFPFTCVSCWEVAAFSLFFHNSHNMTNSSCQRQKLKTILPIFQSCPALVLRACSKAFISLSVVQTIFQKFS